MLARPQDPGETRQSQLQPHIGNRYRYIEGEGMKRALPRPTQKTKNLLTQAKQAPRKPIT